MHNIPNTFSPLIFRKTHEIEMMGRLLLQLSLMHQIKNFQTGNIEVISSFLSMEGESLSNRQIKAILEHHAVKVRKEEMREVKNISRVCQYLSMWDPLSIQDLKHAHQLLLKGLDPEAGEFRKEQVIVVEGKRVTHIPPAPREIATLMQEQFRYVRTQKKVSWILKACIFHYGIQYIHPFIDGNGRMGRIWQHLLLLKANPIFNYILIGNLIKENSRDYYQSLDKSDQKRNAHIFIEFCLRKITQAVKGIAKKNNIDSFLPLSRYYEALVKYKGSFDFKEYHHCFPYLSFSSLQRDIQLGRLFFAKLL